MMPDTLSSPLETGGRGIVSGTAPSTSLKSPEQKKASTWTNFNKNWRTRVNAFSGVKGLDLNKHVKPVWQDDMQRVQRGLKPYSNAQVADFVYALLHNKAAIMPKSSSHGGGIFGAVGNALSDVGNLAGSLPQLPGALAHEAVAGTASLSRIIGEAGGLYGHKSGANTALTEWQDKALGMLIPGYDNAVRQRDKLWTQLNKMEKKQGALHTAGVGLTSVPGARVVPGSYTVGNILQGNTKELGHHPMFAALDILPFAAKFGEAEAVVKFGEDAVKAAKAGDEISLIPKGSAWEALAKGRPIIAATRYAGITGELGGVISDALDKFSGLKDVPLVQRNPAQIGGVATRVSKKIGVSSEVRDVTRRWSMVIREGIAQMRWGKLRDTYARIAKQSMLDVRVAEEMVDRAENMVHEIEQADRKITDAESSLAPGRTNSMELGKAKKALEIAKKNKQETIERTTEQLAQAQRDLDGATKDIKRVGYTDVVDSLWRDHATNRVKLEQALEDAGMTPTQIKTHIEQYYMTIHDFASRVGVNSDFKNLLVGIPLGVPATTRVILESMRNAILNNALIPKYLADPLLKL